MSARLVTRNLGQIRCARQLMYVLVSFMCLYKQKFNPPIAELPSNEELLEMRRPWDAWAAADGRPRVDGTMARRGSRRSRVHLDARSCKAAWRRSCCPQRFHGPRLRGSLGSRQSWDLNRSPQAHYPTRLRGFGKPSILRLMGRGSPAAPGPPNRKIEKAPSAISPSILPKPTPV